MVDTLVVAALVPLVAKLLRGAAQALRLSEIEVRLKDQKIVIKVNGKQKVVEADTFDIRDAVRELIATGKAEFDQPGYKVKLKDDNPSGPPAGSALSAPTGEKPKS